MDDLDYLHTDLFDLANRQQEMMKKSINHQRSLNDSLERTVMAQKVVLSIMILIAIAGFASIRMALVAINHLA